MVASVPLDSLPPDSPLDTVNLSDGGPGLPPSIPSSPSSPSSPTSYVREQRRFVLAACGRAGACDACASPDSDQAHEQLACRDVAGFREATIAAQDPRAPTPTRLTLVDPDDAATEFLARWAEDVEQVRRRLTVRRVDGVEVSLVATIASFGEGVATSLAVESIGALSGGAILRSGVHSRAEVEAALARLARLQDH